MSFTSLTFPLRIDFLLIKQIYNLKFVPMGKNSYGFCLVMTYHTVCAISLGYNDALVQD